MDDSERENALLCEIVEHFINHGAGPDIKRFRADNYKFIGLIERLQRTGKLEADEKGKYKIPLGSLPLTKAWPREKRITEAVIKTISGLYYDSPGEIQPVSLLEKAAFGIRPGDIQRTLIYLNILGLIHGFRSDPETGSFTHFAPDEKILEETTLEERISAHEVRRQAPPMSSLSKMLRAAAEENAQKEPRRDASLRIIESLIQDADGLEARGLRLLQDFNSRHADFKLAEPELRSLANEFSVFARKALALISKHTPHDLKDAQVAAKRGQDSVNDMRVCMKENHEQQKVFDWFLESIASLRGSCEAVKISINPAGAEAIDPLLTILARGTLEKSLPAMLHRCRTQKQPISVFMLDIDHFKIFNDTHGHQTGDDVLRAAAAVINNAVGEKGVIIRYGGEEIIILLPNYSSPEAKVLAERIRSSIEAYDFKGPAGASLKITVSIGIKTGAPTESFGPKEIVALADKALSEAKVAGRNRVVTCD